MLTAGQRNSDDRRGQKVLVEDMERNAELGISLQMLSAVKCGVSWMTALWERLLERLTPHFIFIRAKQGNVSSLSSGLNLNLAAPWPAGTIF